QAAYPNKSLTAFREWYRQAGTPKIHVSTQYDASTKQYTVQIRQENPAVGIERLQGQEVTKPPLLIPIKVGMVGPNGQSLSARLDTQIADEFLLELDSAEKSWIFHDVNHEPVLSI